MKQIEFTFILLLAGILVVQAQDNFKLGYIITNEIDTINGWIDYRTDTQNGAVCKFKATKNDPLQQFMPGSIYGYRFIHEGKFYISKSIELNGIPRVVFLDFLVQGIINLYHYTDNSDLLLSNVEYYFFEDEDGKITTITKRPDKYILDNSRGLVLWKDYQYKGIVRYLFQDSEPVVKETDQLAFTQASMIEITKTYHDQICTTGEPCIIFESTPDKYYNSFQFSVFGGMHWSRRFQDKNLNYKISPLIGGRMNISVPRINKYLSAQFDIALSKVSGRAMLSKTNPNYYDEDYICVPILIGCKYAYGKYKFRPSIAAGMSYVSLVDYNFVVSYMGKTSYEVHENYSGSWGLYASVGLDYGLNNGQAIFINADACPTLDMGIVAIKLGYTF